MILKIRQFFCKHKRTRCVHGKELEEHSKPKKKYPYPLNVCLECDKYIYDGMYSEMCFYTKKEHDWVKTGQNLRNKE